MKRVASRTIAITEEYQIARACRMAVALAREIGMSQTRIHHVATAVSELASNLFYHGALQGMLTVTTLLDGDNVGVEVVSQDQGPGISDIDLVMQDGHSTRGGLGSGLPGVRRLMDTFEISSQVGVGTRVVASKWERPCKSA